MTCEMTIPGACGGATMALDPTTQLILAEESFLRRFAKRFARQSADADDLVQETLLRAYQARHRFAVGTSIRAWLAVILRRLFLTGMRTERRRATHADTDSDDVLSRICDARTGDAMGEAAETPSLRLDRLDDSVKRAFDELPGGYRELLVLAAVEGCSYREIATKLDIPVGTVMSRLHRARRRIQSVVGSRRLAS